MRISRLKSNGKFLEMQTFSTTGTLITNAVLNGYDENDVEEVEIDNQEWKAILEELNPETEEQIKEKKIQKEMRKMAKDRCSSRSL